MPTLQESSKTDDVSSSSVAARRCPDYEHDEKARTRAVERFLAGLEVSATDYVWVASRPPLYASRVPPASRAHRCGLRQGDRVAGLGGSMQLPHDADESAAGRGSFDFLPDLYPRRRDVLGRSARHPRGGAATRRRVFPDDAGGASAIKKRCPSLRVPAAPRRFAAQLRRLAARPRASLPVHVLRDRDVAAHRRDAFPGPLVAPAGLVLDCVVDSPAAVVDALRGHAAEREPVLVGLLEPLLQSALDVLRAPASNARRGPGSADRARGPVALRPAGRRDRRRYHSVEKRGGFDPRGVRGNVAAGLLKDTPALLAVNDFADLDRGVPRLAPLTQKVFDAYACPDKRLVRYNAPLRLALRGTLDAMSSKFLSRAFDFLRGLEGFEPAPEPRGNQKDGVASTPRPAGRVDAAAATRIGDGARVDAAENRADRVRRPTAPTKASARSCPLWPVGHTVVFPHRCRRARRSGRLPCRAGASRRGLGPRRRRRKPSTITRARRWEATTGSKFGYHQ